MKLVSPNMRSQWRYQLTLSRLSQQSPRFTFLRNLNVSYTFNSSHDICRSENTLRMHKENLGSLSFDRWCYWIDHQALGVSTTWRWQQAQRRACSSKAYCSLEQSSLYGYKIARGLCFRLLSNSPYRHGYWPNWSKAVLASRSQHSFEAIT